MCGTDIINLELNWVTRLTRWFEVAQRDMPWRSRPVPYFVWLSEIMLQQTQVDTVIPYFNRFIAAFPTVESLAGAPLQEVLKLWEGLGYYNRARNLHKTAAIVANSLNGKFPRTYDTLQQLPGIGPYVAAAVVSIAFEVPVPVVDGNVLRVFARFWGLEDDIRQPKVRNLLFARLIPYIQTAKPSIFNQAIMELGALVCSPKKPQCGTCPLAQDCVAFQTLRVSELPFKSPAKKVPHHTVVVGVIWKAGRFLIARRREDQMLGGLWELPGGKIESAENHDTALSRIIQTDTGLAVTVSSLITVVEHAYSHFKITLYAYACNWESGIAQALSSDEIQWVTLPESTAFPFPKTTQRVLEAINRC